MKKTIILAVLALASTVTSAQHHHGDHHRHSDNRWIAPLIIGGILGYSIRQNQPVQPQQAPIIIYQPPVFTSPRPIQPAPMLPVYRESIEYDPNCQCYVNVVRQIGWQ